MDHRELHRLVAESFVCEKTIARYLGGKPVQRVTRARIEEAAKRLRIRLPDVEHPPVTRKPRTVTP